MEQDYASGFHEAVSYTHLDVYKRQVLDEVATWQARPLEPVYPLVFFDALRVKIRDEGLVRNKAVHIALGVRADGTKEILGLWLEQNEGAKFWLRVMNEMKTRSVQDLSLIHIFNDVNEIRNSLEKRDALPVTPIMRGKHSVAYDRKMDIGPIGVQRSGNYCRFKVPSYHNNWWRSDIFIESLKLWIS